MTPSFPPTTNQAELAAYEVKKQLKRWASTILHIAVYVLAATIRHFISQMDGEA